ncbi:UDP-glucose 4-epimerase [bacterium BMS3Abin07]|nr:UDP-glucose 4-epimerase [bacterium BMS3Abin07]HDO21605.1 SDR family oxidoreductase [Nitrospirota bacterium]HDZ88548.1 SDR family oxidoreductase [Nitrospirota bacterium]
MKILITGNMGYIGPSLVERLRISYPDAALVGFDMGYFANCLTNARILPECRLDMQYFGDIRGISKDLLEDVDAIVHLAAISNDPMGKTFERVTFDINYKASVDLAVKAKEAGVGTFVYASSCSMYGSSDDGPRTEESPLNPLTAYARSKISTEKDIEKLAGNRFKVTSLRFSTACGMSERLRLDLVLNDFVAGAVSSGKVTILSDGTPWRPLINIKDMARAIDWAICRNRTDGGNFLAVNIGTDEWNYQVRDLAGAVAEVIPDVDISINENAQPDKRSYRVGFELFKRLAPDYQPEVDIITTIKELKAGLEAINFKDDNFRNSGFMRLKVLNHLRETELLTENLEWRNNHKL